jgi:hypothetical protein
MIALVKATQQQPMMMQQQIMMMQQAANNASFSTNDASSNFPATSRLIIQLQQ